MKTKKYANGMSVTCVNRNECDRHYTRKQTIIDFYRVRDDFIRNFDVPKGFEISYGGKVYREGDRLAPRKPLAGVQPSASIEAGPSLDMFEATNPNAPRSIDQNKAFWALLDKLSEVTGKTPTEMKAVLVTRALGENKGTSKLTVTEMDRLIQYVKDTIDMFTAAKEEFHHGK